MRPAIVLSLLFASLAQANPPPTRAALRKAFEANRPALVEVVGPKRAGGGVLVGAAGQVLTAVDFVGLDEAKVRHAGRELPARVLLANAALKVAVVEIDPPGEYPATAVRSGEGPGAGSWLVSITRTRRGGLAPGLARVVRPPSERSPFLEVDAPLPAGTPLFDAQGRLVALAVSGPRKAPTRALPLLAVKAQLAAEPQP